jgi:hypothetical protein
MTEKKGGRRGEKQKNQKWAYSESEPFSNQKASSRWSNSNPAGLPVMEIMSNLMNPVKLF